MISRFISRRPWLAFPVLVLMLLAAAAVWLGSCEFIAAKRLAAELEAMKENGDMVDNETMRLAFEGSTAKDGTAAWTEVFALNQAMNNLHQSKIFKISNLGSGEDFEWKDRKLAKSYLDRVQPVIDEIEKACNCQKPVWQPIHFNGVSTLLAPIQEARQAIRLLTLDARYAIGSKAFSRAQRSLRLASQACEAFDYDLFIVMKLASCAMHQDVWSTIRQSLLDDGWSESQLADLASYVRGPEDLKSAWPLLVQSELAVGLDYLASVSESEFSFGPERESFFSILTRKLPSRRLEYLKLMQPYMQAASDGLETLPHEVAELELRSTNRWAGRFGGLGRDGMWQSTAQAFVRQENLRRLTLVAIALRQFHKANDKWPEQLSELDSNLVKGDLTRTVGKIPLGYSVDGEQAHLWTVRVDTNSQTSYEKAIVSFDELQAEPKAYSPQYDERWLILNGTSVSDTDE